MKVEGRDVPQAAIDAGLAVIQLGKPFKAAEVESAMSSAGGWDHCLVDYMRAADKLLQRERRAGRIRFLAGRWDLVHGGAA